MGSDIGICVESAKRWLDDIATISVHSPATAFGLERNSSTIFSGVRASVNMEDEKTITDVFDTLRSNVTVFG